MTAGGSATAGRAPVLGIIGGGQLARMMLPACIELGVEPRVFAESADSAAALAATAFGAPDDADAVLAFAKTVDVVTFDHEHVPQRVLASLVAAGVTVHPGPHALRFAQNKLAMRERLTELGVPVPGWAAVGDERMLAGFLDDHGGVGVLKRPTGGYDGNGVRIIRKPREAADWFDTTPVLLVEELVPFRRELAQLVARRPGGGMASWPLVQTEQRDGTCVEVIAPAPDSGSRVDEAARHIAEQIAEGLDVTGVLAVELFETDDQLLVNELAMRPHNSGHWSMDAAITGQFEQHVRAVLDLPLGDPSARQDWAVMVNVLGGPEGDVVPGRYPSALGEHPAAKVHAYGKASRPGRKVGHVTAYGEVLDEVVYTARATAARLSQ